MVRLSFVSHKFLLNSVKEEILSDFKDMILEAISAKLSSYENTQADYSINTKARDCYKKKNEKKILKKLEVEQKQEVSLPEKSEDSLTPKKKTHTQSHIYESI